jgi:hypothetical protein
VAISLATSTNSREKLDNRSLSFSLGEERAKRKEGIQGLRGRRVAN